MDLVSSTLDRYLKHRFNVDGLHQQQQSGPQHEVRENNSLIPKVYNIVISNIPCCLDIRDDLEFLAVGFDNSHIHLWETVTTNQIHTTLIGHTGAVYGIKFIRDDLMLSCSEDCTIRLWCLKTMSNLSTYRGHTYPIWSIDVGPQGIMFATSSMDTTARLWRLDKMTPLRIFCGHDADVDLVKFHPNEKYIATGSSDKTVRLWSIADGLMVRLMIGHEERIVDLSFLPDGKILASASSDGVIKLWDLATNTITCQMTVPASCKISFSSDVVFVSSCGVDNTLRLSQVVWSNSTRELVERKTYDNVRLIKSQFIKDKLYLVTSKD